VNVNVTQSNKFLRVCLVSELQNLYYLTKL